MNCYILGLGPPRPRGTTPRLGSPQDVVSFGAAISACAKAAEWRLALRLLEEVKRRQLDPRHSGC